MKKIKTFLYEKYFIFFFYIWSKVFLISWFFISTDYFLKE